MLTLHQLVLILQVVASLLALDQNNQSIPEEMKHQAVSLARQGVEVATKTLNQSSTLAVTLGSAPGERGEVTAPDHSSSVGLSYYPDKLVRSIPADPITVTYLIEHRSALNGKAVRVRGVVVRTLLGEVACPSGGAGVPPGACAQPSIYLADEGKDPRDANANIRVLVNASDTNYYMDQVVVIRGTVSGNQSAVLLIQDE
jgi:hypothetical protein